MFIKLYFIALPVLLAIDSIWLGVVSKGFYSKQIGHLMKDGFSLLPALLFYITFTVGLVYLVIMPAVESGSFYKALIGGAILGFISYAAYDLTNQATLKNWPIIMTVVDMLWGTVLTTLTAVITYWLYNR